MASCVYCYTETDDKIRVLVASGGIDNYEPQKKIWIGGTINEHRRIKDMIYWRYAHALIPLSGAIFAIGGYEN